MKYRKLGDTLYVKGRIGWKGLKKKEYLSDGNYRIINGSNIVSNNIDWNNCGYVTEERYEESPEIMLQENDILITKDGTIGKVALVKKLEKPTTIASGLFLLRNTDPEKWDTLYLFYYLQSRRFKEFIHSRIEGSVIPHLYQKDFEDMKLPKVSLQVQKKIARKLDSIQRKIELNNRINANLAELKTTLFIKIFGNKMTSSLNGKLSDLAKIKSGKRPTIKQEKSDALFPYPIIGASKVMGYTNDYLYNEPVITTGRVGTHGVIQYFKDPVWISDNSFAIITKYENYIFELLSHRINYSALNTGSTQPLITQKNLRNVDIYVPASSELNNFESKVSSMTNLQFNLKKESDKLNEIRQLLLNDEFKLLN